MIVLPEARKLLDGAVPEGDYFNAFNFKVEDAKTIVSEVQIPGLKWMTNEPAPTPDPSLSPEGEHANRGDDIYFGYIKFDDVPKTRPHKKAYVYRVTEIPGNDANILYDTDVEFYAQVIITGPVTEEELARGIRADIYMGERHRSKEGQWGDIIWDRDIPVTLWSNDMKDTPKRTPEKDCGSQHEVLMDANGKEFYRHDGKFWSYPNDTELKPVSSVDSDINHQVKCPAFPSPLNVYEDRNRVEYVKSGGKYYTPYPFCHELIEGVDVWPDHADKPIREKLVVSVPKREGKSGKGYRDRQVQLSVR